LSGIADKLHVISRISLSMILFKRVNKDSQLSKEQILLKSNFVPDLSRKGIEESSKLDFKLTMKLVIAAK
jgi:hypothetical protein